MSAVPVFLGLMFFGDPVFQLYLEAKGAYSSDVFVVILGFAVSILFLISCSTDSSLLSKSRQLTDGQSENSSSPCPMAFDHEEDVGMKFNKCFYIATNDSVGEKIGDTSRQTLSKFDCL